MFTGLTVAVVGLLFGPVGAVVGMIKAFEEVGESGIGDPRALSDAIGNVLASSVLGTLAGLLGLILFIVSLVIAARERKRPQPTAP
jgi:biopolymer transport protein ExbB